MVEQNEVVAAQDEPLWWKSCAEKVDGLWGILREFSWFCQLILYTVKKAPSDIPGAADYGTTPRCWNIPAT